MRSAILKAGAIGVLRGMVGPEYRESTCAGLRYLRVVARFGRPLPFPFKLPLTPHADQDGVALPSREILSLVPQVVGALRIPHRRVQRTAMETLRFLSAQGMANSGNCTRYLWFVHIEDLRAPIVEGLLDLLKDRHAGVLFAASTVLGFLAADSMSSLPFLASYEDTHGWAVGVFISQVLCATGS